MTAADPLLDLLRRLQTEEVDYVLVGGQAVRLNGYSRATEDIDLLIKPGRDNGQRILRALAFLPSSKELDINWFEAAPDGEAENIRVADELLIDLLFSANGHSYESLRPNIRELAIDGVAIRVLDIDGLLKTKTDYREKDVLDKQVLTRIQSALNSK